jgi:hypothetical protein
LVGIDEGYIESLARMAGSQRAISVVALGTGSFGRIAGVPKTLTPATAFTVYIGRKGVK